MNPTVELNLALILFLPWFSILAVLFWLYPRQPRTPVRRAFDGISLVLATLLSGWGMHWGFLHADPHAGAIWKQVLATSVAYGLFLMAMLAAIALRVWWLSRPAR
ncbi:hypothetical protein [Pseudoxanthomonas putridarboris]|uniref:Transmembrane protein n=1 Tax=Pseudoxanthomonas putridarboris TaxID=752605 RepID=A0ABU9J2E3_9GAMM